jgi:imidazolonepropionase-like amidohydrolase
VKGLIIAAAVFCGSAAAADLRIDHVIIVSPERAGPMQDASVYIRGGRIAFIRKSSNSSVQGGGRNIEVIDGTGFYLAPGLIDSHVHTGGVPGMGPAQQAANPEIASELANQVPRSYLYFGFTTLIDLDSTPARIAKWNASAVHPDIYFCGGAPVVDGYPMNWDPKPERYQAYPYLIVQKGDESSAAEGIDPAAHTAATVVARMKKDGALCVKAFFDRGAGGGEAVPVPRLDTLKELVYAAHAAKMPVLLHAMSPEGQTLGLDAGVDILAHGLWDWRDEPEAVSDLTPGIMQILDRVIKTKTGVQPTMQVAYGFRDLFDPEYLSDLRARLVYPANAIAWFKSPEGQWFHDLIAPGVLGKTMESNDAAVKWEAARSTYTVTIARGRHATEYLVRRHARLLFGTDTPAAPTYANPPGLNGWLEMHRLAEAGLTAGDIFRAVTLSSAVALGLAKEIGTIQVGKKANLLLLRENPAETIEAYDEIEKVILRGVVLDRGDLAASR